VGVAQGLQQMQILVAVELAQGQELMELVVLEFA
jgi:hypothetical protein